MLTDLLNVNVGMKGLRTDFCLISFVLFFFFWWGGGGGGGVMQSILHLMTKMKAFLKTIISVFLT